MISDQRVEAKTPDPSRRNFRRREGLVSFFRLETLGFDGPATTITEPGACPKCLEMCASLCPGCRVTDASSRAFEKGLVTSRRSDGEWILELTSEGILRAGEIDKARRAR